MTTINFPDNLNGITEAGIAAGVDEFKDLSYSITIRYRATQGAPARPTPAEVRAKSVAGEWNALADADSRAAFRADNARIIGQSGVAVDDIIAHFDNWPADEATARGRGIITANLATTNVDAYDAWVILSPPMRGHVELDLEMTLRTLVPPGTNAKAKRVFQGLVAFAVSNGWVIRDEVAAHGMVRYAGPEVTPAVTRTIAQVNEVGFIDAQEAANLLVALKITWWLINHHVGQKEGVIESFAGKIAKLQDLMSDTNVVQGREVRSALWAVGKMNTTRGILSAVGINGIVYVDASNTGRPEGNDYALGGVLTIGVSPDVRLRIEGNPAGSAVTSTYFAIAKRAAMSIFSVCMPPLANLSWDNENRAYAGRVKDDMDAIAANPARYHMGSQFLTGQPRITAESWNDEEKANLSAFIHATAGTSSLAKASVVIPKDEIVGNMVYTTIQAVRVSMADTVANRANMLLISRMGGGIGNGGMARQFGRIADNDVAVVQQQLTLIDEGDVSDDEPAPSARESAQARTDRLARNEDRKNRRTARNQALALLPRVAGPAP